MDINIVKLKKYASACSVLYVEDDEVIRTATASFLGRFFSDIVLAEDGEIGLEKYKEREFDIVITDINMPNMNGIEMIEAIKEIKYEQVILVTSAHNDSEILMKFIALDVNRFVLKPFNNKQFLYVLYKIAEEITYFKEEEQREYELGKASKKAQEIIDHVDVGIVILENNELSLANKAFLEIGGFGDMDTLKLEMPVIGVLFKRIKNCISADTNEELIKKLLDAKREDSKVRVLQENKTKEYQVSISAIKENSYVLTFTDVTAIHNAMYLDQNTKLPSKKFILEKIELLSDTLSSIDVILINIKHFSNIKKVYGQRESLAIEKKLAEGLKSIKQVISKKAFIGHFGEDRFFIVSPKNDFETLYNELKLLKVYTTDYMKINMENGTDVELDTNVFTHNLDLTQELTQIELDLINAYEMKV